ncbi:MAG: hypothetical protein OSB43_15285, partial [Nocardioides sp.]|nr:hypothetical protein [Nocardioides sp.]
LGLVAVGTLASPLSTVVDRVDDPDGGAVVYYLDDTAVRGVRLWDGAGDLDAARELLASGRRPSDASTLRGCVR